MTLLNVPTYITTTVNTLDHLSKLEIYEMMTYNDKNFTGPNEHIAVQSAL